MNDCEIEIKTRKRTVNKDNWDKTLKKVARHSFEVKTVISGNPRVSCAHSTMIVIQLVKLRR